MLITFYYFYDVFTQIHSDPMFRTVSQGSRGPQGQFSEGSSKLEEVGKSSRKFEEEDKVEEVGEGSRKLEKVQGSWRKLEKVQESEES